MNNEYSAGGIVFKIDTGVTQLLLVKHAKFHEWGFPKGHIGDTMRNESREEAAIREVKEETGIDAEIISPAAEEHYIYKVEGVERSKTVYYYFMRYKSGNFAGKDHEMEDVAWVDLEHIENQLTHDNAKEMFRSVRPKLERILVDMGST